MDVRRRQYAVFWWFRRRLGHLHGVAAADASWPWREQTGTQRVAFFGPHFGAHRFKAIGRPRRQHFSGRKIFVQGRRLLRAMPLRPAPQKLLLDRRPVWKSNLRRVRPESPRRPPRHRRDTCSMAWRCRFLTARRSQRGHVIAVHPTHWLISTQACAAGKKVLMDAERSWACVVCFVVFSRRGLAAPRPPFALSPRPRSPSPRGRSWRPRPLSLLRVDGVPVSFGLRRRLCRRLRRGLRWLGVGASTLSGRHRRERRGDGVGGG